MGMIYADIELINYDDMVDARRYRIGEDEIKRMHVNMLVDTGSLYMCINESIQEYLQLPFCERRGSVLADGIKITLDVVGPIWVKFKNRQCRTSAIILPRNNEPLLGALTMEDMDVVIHPATYTLDVHPDHLDMPVMSLKTITTNP